LRCLAADDPAHRWIVTQTLGIVHVLIASETTEYRLPQQPTSALQPFLPVRASASVSPAFALNPSASRVRDMPAIRHRT
jgi:hypothetical protein